jgi:two-component system, OmpR family, phosphate regulon response regulator PhoB
VRASLKAAGVGWQVQSVYATGYRLTLAPGSDAQGATTPDSESPV